MPTIWDTLLYIGYLEEIWQGGGMVAQNAKTKDYIYWSKKSNNNIQSKSSDTN